MASEPVGRLLVWPSENYAGKWRRRDRSEGVMRVDGAWGLVGVGEGREGKGPLPGGCGALGWLRDLEPKTWARLMHFDVNSLAFWETRSFLRNLSLSSDSWCRKSFQNL